MKCRICESGNTTRSSRKGIEKLLKYFYPRAPYRCKECWSRFWVFENPFNTLVSKVIASCFLCMLVLFFVWMFLPNDPDISRKPEKTGRKYVNRTPETADIKPAEDTLEEKMPDAGDIQPEVSEPVHEKAPEISESPDTDQAAAVNPLEPETRIEEEPESLTSASEIPKTANSAANPPVKPEISQPASPAAEIKPAEKADPDKAVHDALHSKKSEMYLEKIKINTKEKAVASSPELPFQHLKKIIYKASPGEFEILIKSDGPVIRDYQSFFLFEDNVPKVVVDISGNWKQKVPYITVVDSDIVKQIRVGEHPDYIRVVMDLKINERLSPVFTESPEGLGVSVKKGRVEKNYIIR